MSSRKVFVMSNGFPTEFEREDAQMRVDDYLRAEKDARASKEAAFMADVRAQLDSQRAEQKPASSADTALAGAIEQLDAERWTGNATNIHQKAFGTGDDSPAAEPEGSFDAQQFERRFGLAPGYLDGVKTESEAHEALRLASGEVAEADAAAAQMARISDCQRELHQRIEQHLDSWSSPKYGNAQDALTAEHWRERNKLGQAIKMHLQALMDSGQPVPTIEQLMNRARLSTDPSWRPSFKRPPQYKSIHEALQNNRA
jgi:hypothetical protein